MFQSAMIFIRINVGTCQMSASELSLLYLLSANLDFCEHDRSDLCSLGSGVQTAEVVLQSANYSIVLSYHSHYYHINHLKQTLILLSLLKYETGQELTRQGISCQVCSLQTPESMFILLGITLAHRKLKTFTII